MLKMKRINGKRGDIAIASLVLMTLVLSGTALFVFLTSNKIEKIISDARFVEEMYVKEEKVNFYLHEVAESALIKTYSDLVGGNGFIAEPQEKVNMYVVFDKIVDDETLNKKFKDAFSENLKEEFEIEFEDDVLQELKKEIDNGNFNVEFDREMLNLKLRDFRILVKKEIKEKKIVWVYYILPLGTKEEIKEQMALVYNPEIKIEINMTETGLRSFQEIFSVSEECKTKEKIEECMAKLENFNVGLEDYKDYKLITLTTKKKFFVGEEFRNIELKFLI